MPIPALPNFRKREFRPERPNRPPKTPSKLRDPQIRSDTTPSRSAGDPDCSPALL
jgi:hypothetical protein